MEKTIKIKLVGFWTDFDPNTNILINCLKKRYDVQFVEEGQEYIICSVFGEPYEFCKYPQPRIMYSGENYIPDFNLIDYSICSYPVDFFDRNFRLPLCFSTECRSAFELVNKNRNYDDSILKTKKYFANFIASHESEDNIRGDFFKRLCEYKRVESPGSYLNNMPDGVCVDRDNKIEFQKSTKFTLCFESTKHNGFITEKISDAFYADTIPVYYGSADIGEIFNKKAFIDCSDYATFGEVVKKIIELDNDDDKYLEMLRQPIFASNYNVERLKCDFAAFVYNIFDQPFDKAYRRSCVFASKSYNDFLVKIKNEVHRKIDINLLTIKETFLILVSKIYKKFFNKK